MIRLEDAGLRLSAMIVGLEPGGEVTIVAGGEPIAHLRRAARTSSTCQSGTAEAWQHGMAPEFHASVEDSGVHGMKVLPDNSANLRPVRRRFVPGATLAARASAVTGELTSTAGLYRFLRRWRELQRHWA